MDPAEPRWVRRWQQTAAWLDASVVELVGLVLLVAGAGAVALVLVSRAPDPAPVAEPMDAVPEAEEEVEPPAPVLVHVAGAVERPGLVELADGSRVADAIDAAGGPVADAEVGELNLARPLTDGERVYIPVAGQHPAAAPSAAGSTGVLADGRVNLNLATREELEGLPGVGPVLAGRIVTHREEHGQFTEVGQLRDVTGIGEKTFQSLVDLVVI